MLECISLLASKPEGYSVLNFALSSGVGVGAGGIGAQHGCRLDTRVEILFQWAGFLVGLVTCGSVELEHVS